MVYYGSMKDPANTTILSRLNNSSPVFTVEFAASGDMIDGLTRLMLEGCAAASKPRRSSKHCPALPCTIYGGMPWFQVDGKLCILHFTYHFT